MMLESFKKAFKETKEVYFSFQSYWTKTTFFRKELILTGGAGSPGKRTGRGSQAWNCRSNRNSKSPSSGLKTTSTDADATQRRSPGKKWTPWREWRSHSIWAPATTWVRGPPLTMSSGSLVRCQSIQRAMPGKLRQISMILFCQICAYYACFASSCKAKHPFLVKEN